MEDEEVMENDMLNVTVPKSQQKVSPYELLLRQNKKLGRFATAAFRGVRTVLHQEIPFLSKEQFLHTLTLTSHQKEAISKKTELSLNKIDTLKREVRRSHEVLASARTVFPMKLFPDRVILDRTKITIVRRDFFWSSNVVSIRIEDVLNVTCGMGPLFGSISISSRVMNSIDHFEINFLWRSDAMQLKDLIQGYVIAKHNKINTNDLSRKELIETISELGRDSDTR